MIIWLASYPKSGNTWLRALLSSYLYTETGEFDFNILEKIDSFPNPKQFSSYKDKFEKVEDTAKYWIKEQENLNKDKKLKILKTHNALFKIGNSSFTNNENTLGVVYIVRDPRNVITSICNHYQINHEQALEFMKTQKKALFSKKQNRFLAFQPILSWSLNYKSWAENIKYKTLLVKYEDLENETYITFYKTLKFIKEISNNNFKINEQKIKKCITSCEFDRLKKLEDKIGFNEAPKIKNSNERLKFFNLGKKNNWKNILSVNIVNEVEKEFNSEMKDLGYL
tara:strand:- start:6704 stop:7549 length:846 start_codon:yes stop_codon:yes gene_type:complete